MEKPWAMIMGRFVPFTDSHMAMVRKAIDEVGAAMIVVQDTRGAYEDIEEDIFEAMNAAGYSWGSQWTIRRFPNVTKMLVETFPEQGVETSTM